MENKKYEYWLHRMPETGNGTIRELLRRFHTPFEVYGAVRRRSRGVLEVLTEARMDQVVEYTVKYDLNREYEELLRKEIRFLTPEDEDYPQRLRKIPLPPYGLYVIGELPPENLPAVAMIGARECSEYGTYVAKSFAKELGVYGIPVISGMARGIDSISQEAALQGGGRTYAVLGCGVDICYPKSSRKLYERMKEQGGILSTFPPGTEPMKRLFPERNRIVSGLSDVVLVVEARQKSGTFITVDMALEQGKEVYAIPGRLTDRLSDGCNLLLQQGALIAVSPQDLLQHLLPKQMELSLDTEAETLKENDAATGHSTDAMTDFRSDAEPERRVDVLTKILDFQPKSLEEIRMEYEKKTDAAITVTELLCRLMDLCLEGKAEQVSSNYYVKKEIAGNAILFPH